MRVIITRDTWDGVSGKAGEFDLDGLGISQLILMLAGSKVASITITKVLPLEKAIERSVEKKEKSQ